MTYRASLTEDSTERRGRGTRVMIHLCSGFPGECADDITERYLQMLEKHRVRGYLFEQQNYTDPSQLATPAKK